MSFMVGLVWRSTKYRPLQIQFVRQRTENEVYIFQSVVVKLAGCGAMNSINPVGR
jgi:hypothetical protein